MKIGILTFHYSINQGSVIQAYCVQNLLNETFPDANVEVINLVPFMREKHELRFYNKKFPFLSLSKIQKYRSIRKFAKSHLNLSSRVYYNSLNSQIEYINKQNYDIIFTGSDTVWFDTIKLNNQIPNIYFLPNELNAKKISIAASVDPLKDESVYTNNSEKLTSVFSDYSLITVRDEITLDLVSKFANSKVEMIADPTILFDFEKKLNFKIGNRAISPKKKKIAIGISDKSITQQIIKRLENQYEVYNMINNNSLQFDYIFDELNMYSGYDVLITDRFHRSIFSLKLSNALVVNIERSNKNQSKNSKGRDLFEKIGLSDYLLRYEVNNTDFFFTALEETIKYWDIEKLNIRQKKMQSFIAKEKKHWNRIISKV